MCDTLRPINVASDHRVRCPGRYHLCGIVQSFCCQRHSVEVRRESPTRRHDDREWQPPASMYRMHVVMHHDAASSRDRPELCSGRSIDQARASQGRGRASIGRGVIEIGERQAQVLIPLDPTRLTLQLSQSGGCRFAKSMAVGWSFDEWTQVVFVSCPLHRAEPFQPIAFFLSFALDPGSGVTRRQQFHHCSLLSCVKKPSWAPTSGLSVLNELHVYT